jgi:CheY-like chemotaxis protein
MQGTNGESFETLCKVRRIGKPGQHYLVACMDEILPPQGAALLGDLKIPINSAGESPTSPVVETAAFHTAVPLSSESHSCSKVVIASSKSVPAEILSGMGEKHECEICLLNSVAELAAFLPAVKEAGITIDFVLVDYALGPAALTIVSKESLNYRIIPPDWKPETAIDFLFKRPVMSEPDLQTAHTESMPFLGQPNPDKPGKSREDRVKILAIEDNPINGMALGQILESLGVAHSIVTTGIEALARLREGTFDLVLCDMTLPDMEPHILVQAIIDAGSGRRLPLPVVGMTSGDRDDQRQACLDCGMAEGVAKPLSPEIIDSIIRQNVLPPTPRSTQAA